MSDKKRLQPNEWKQETEKGLDRLIDECVLDSGMRERMKYSLLPPGKLFRPFLVYQLAHDLGGVSLNHLIFGCSLEMHHCYTLIHDDLPSMDDDDMRRGKPSAHIKYSEWEAILTGDSLLGLSFQLLSKLETNHLSTLLDLYGQKTGAQGLVLGQIIDMKAKSKSLGDVLRIHELKTAALMQLALMGGAILSERSEIVKRLETLGYKLGVNFQLLDDLCELRDEVQGHEKEANPFLHFNVSEIFSIIKENSISMRRTCEDSQLVHLNQFIQSFEASVYAKISESDAEISKKIDFNLNDWTFLLS